MKGHLDSFFLEKEEFALKEESYETCYMWIWPSRQQFFLQARPNDIYYIEEEIITPVMWCNFKFPYLFDQKAVLLKSLTNLRSFLGSHIFKNDAYSEMS